MLKIGILQLGYETNTFLSGYAELAALGSGQWLPGDTLVSLFEDKHAGLSGALRAIREAAAEPVGIDSMCRGGAFNAGPTLSKQCIEEAVAHVCGCLENLKLDGLFLAGHGATMQMAICFPIFEKLWAISPSCVLWIFMPISLKKW